MAVQVISGRDVILFFRERALHATEDATKLRFQTEHLISEEKEAESTLTKDGIINSISDGENKADITSLAYRDDQATLATWKQLKSMFKRKALVEMWQVDITDVTPESPEVEATYFQGYFTSFEQSNPADGNVELSYSYAINGNGVEGTDTLTPAQLEAVQSLMYEYEKMAATGDVVA